MLPIVVLLSGSGSNLQALINDTSLPIEIRAVISNEESAYGLLRASQAGIPTYVIPHQNFPTREAFDEALATTIDSFTPDLVVLAGFMRRLTASFVHQYLGRLINIHPSLLPRHPGLDTHQRVLEAEDAEHGATTHYVVPELDAGPILFQAAFKTPAGQSPGALKKRVQALEHQLYPHTLREMALGNVTFREGRAYYLGKPLPKEGVRINLGNF